jgi:hypothetical protein
MFDRLGALGVSMLAERQHDQTPISVSERRLAIARRLYEALVDQDPNRAITLCDGQGRVVTHHYPRTEESSPETAS